MTLLRTLRAVLALSLLHGISVAQATWYVDPTNPIPGSGSQADPYASLQYAIEQTSTQSGDELILQPGLYPENINLSGKSLSIRSLQGPEQTVIDGGANGTVLTVENGELNVSLEGITLTNGRSDVSRGDGVRLLANSHLTLRDCHIRDNFGGEFHGGNGLYVESSSLTLEGCWVFNNVAGPLPGPGAGIMAESSHLILRETRFEKNFGSYGGGLWQRGGDTQIVDCEFIDCIANTSGFGEGGAIAIAANVFSGDTYTLEIDGCHFEGGYAYDTGGALQLNFHNATQLGGLVSIHNSTFRRNSADLIGGAISSGLPATDLLMEDCHFEENDLTPQWNWGGTAISLSGTVRRCIFTQQVRGSTIGLGPNSVLENCTVVGNQNGAHGGVAGVVYGGLLRNCIVRGNQGDAFSEPSVVSYSNIQGGWPGTGNLDVDPLFVHPLAGDLRLRPLSPCVDAGDPNSPLDPDGSPADLGAIPFDQSENCPSPELYCEPKLHSGGCEAELTWTGTPAVTGTDDFVVTATQLLPGQFSLAFVSPQPNQVPLFGGTRCTGGDAQRFGPYHTGSGSGCDGSTTIAMDQAFLQSYPVGTLLHLQLLFRDPGFTAPDNVSMTGGLRFTVCR